MKTKVEQGAYVVLGAFDLLAEKATEIPVVRKIRETTLVDQVREIEPVIRKHADALSMRGEVVVSRTIDALGDVRFTAVDVRRSAEGLRNDAADQIEALRIRVSGKLVSLRSRKSAA